MTPHDIAERAVEVDQVAHSQYTELLRRADDVHAVVSAARSLVPGEDNAIVRVTMGLLDAERALATESGEHAEPSTVDAAWRALTGGDLEEADRLAADLIAGRHEAADLFANADGVHNGNIVRGHVALRRSDLRRAARHLMAAADVEGSAVLCSFGPDLSLAWALLGTEEERASFEYFKSCTGFWTAKPRH